jgi:S1-C subfamily serine protease
LQSGDVIVQIGDRVVDDVPSLGDALISKNPGERVPVQVYRSSQHLTVNVTLSELPAR